MSFNNGDWQSPAFRQRVTLEIDDALQKSPNKIGSQNEKSAAEIENQIFGRSASRNIYMSMVGRIILHLQQGRQNQPQPAAPTIHQGSTSTDNSGHWKTRAFRQKVILNIDDVLKKWQIAVGSQNGRKSAAEIEEHIFERSASRDSYLCLAALIIQHLQAESSKGSKLEDIVDGIKLIKLQEED
ncbi:mediator of RNA polymerase II transcription subunit 15-like [Paramuricea clavata]|uniref:Mediator of RNA polymerase II transcription subunit 15 n=1 Tax=Paramuricea clavata TaxID=317549 RepID=A0A7D9HZR7_PARCT|nr:mediator of RNA polymerase II transcription subunit 15-like [Paramuricea clavata]